MVVALAYRLCDEAGRVVDTVTADEPLRYVHGYAQILPGLEAGLEGAAAGERRTLRCPPDEAFGERADDNLLEIDRDDFPGGEQAAVGDEIVATSPDGVEVTHVVVEVSAESVWVDLNHPLAGQTVTFEVEVCEVRPATDEELDAAQRDADELIVGGATIVYGSEPPSDLIPLRSPGGKRRGKS